MVSTTNGIAYWDCDDTTGNLVDDHSSNDLTESGTVPSQTGILSNARGVFSSSNYFSNSSVATINQSVDYSINVWVYRTATISSNRDLILAGGTAASDYYVKIRVPGSSSTNKPQMEIAKQSVAGLLNLNATTALALNTWNMITVTHQASDRECKIYMNGTLSATGTATSNTFNTVGAFQLGLGTGTNTFPEGYADEIWYTQEVLSSTDISALWNSGDGLAYPFTSGTTVSPSAVTFSMTAEVPSYFIDVTQGAISFNLGYNLPEIIIPSVFFASPVAFSMGIPDPTTITGSLPNGTISVGSGTIGSTYISKHYPVSEGLTAGTTKQTGNPNLIALE